MSDDTAGQGPTPSPTRIVTSWSEAAQAITDAAHKATAQLCKEDLPAFLADVTDHEEVGIRVPVTLPGGRRLIFTAALEFED